MPFGGGGGVSMAGEGSGGLTLGLEVAQVKVGHGAEPEAAVGVGGAVVGAEAGVVGGGGEAGEVLVAAGGAVEQGDAVLEADEELLLGVEAGDVGRDGGPLVELQGRERGRAVRHRDGVDSLLLNVDEAQRLRDLFVVGPLAEAAVEVDVRLRDVPLLDVFGG